MRARVELAWPMLGSPGDRAVATRSLVSHFGRYVTLRVSVPAHASSIRDPVLDHHGGKPEAALRQVSLLPPHGRGREPHAILSQTQPDSDLYGPRVLFLFHWNLLTESVRRGPHCPPSAVEGRWIAV